ncbi:MAG: hypothetical protein Q4P36_02655 [Bowdeniella nasicola]|nr:hypothetical protein [Bowdeniella nasicola]
MSHHVRRLARSAKAALAVYPRAVLAVDGRTGAGKSTLAQVLASHLRAAGHHVDILPLDLLAYGWDDLAGAVHAGARLTSAFRALGEARYRPYDWERGRPAERDITVAGDLLIVEGCGALSATLAPLIDDGVIVRASRDTREARITARDHYDWSAERRAWEEQHDALTYPPSVRRP